MKPKILLFIGIVVVAIVAGAFSFANYRHHGSPLPQAKYKEITGYSDGTYVYECSKPIKAKLQRANNGDIPNATVYRPIDQDKARLFCQSTGVIEYKGKLKVLQNPEVLNLISKYQYRDVTIKAVDFKYIQDKDFIHRLLPAYADRQIGCIIILDTPGEDKAYLEDEKLNTFKELDYQVFAHQLGRASAADRQLFYDNLK